MAEQKDGWFGINKLRSWLPRWQWSKDTAITRSFRNIFMNSDVPVLVNKDDLLTPVTDCPHLGLAIAKKCEMFSNGQWKCVSIDDEEKEFPDDEGLVLLNKPNPLQSREDFLWQYMFYKEVFANNFIYKPQGSKLVQPKVLWHLPSEVMEIILTGKMFDQFELSGIIKHFKMCIGGYERQFAVDEVIYHATNFSFEEGAGKSKIPGLNYPISNIMASLKTRNIISVKKGMIGILSNEAKDSVGNITMGEEERKRIEGDFAKERGLYGEGENIIISQSAVKWNATSFPVRDLMLHESDEMDFATILGATGLDRDIFPSTKGATFENKKQGMIMTYDNTIQPEADSFGGIMSEALGATARKRKYILDYSWLPIKQEDRGKEEAADKIKAEKYALLYAYNLISREDFASYMNVTLGPEVKQGNDVMGKIPLALQQLALARERANTANDKQLSNDLSVAMDKLTAQLVTTIIQS